MPSYIAKIVWSPDNIRRVTLDECTYAALLAEGRLPTSSVVKYVDEDGDHLTISSTRELLEAFRFAQEQATTLRLFVTSPSTRPPSPSDPSDDEFEIVSSHVQSVEDVEASESKAVPLARDSSPVVEVFEAQAEAHNFGSEVATRLTSADVVHQLEPPLPLAEPTQDVVAELTQGLDLKAQTQGVLPEEVKAQEDKQVQDIVLWFVTLLDVLTEEIADRVLTAALITSLEFMQRPQLSAKAVCSGLVQALEGVPGLDELSSKLDAATALLQRYLSELQQNRSFQQALENSDAVLQVLLASSALPQLRKLVPALKTFIRTQDIRNMDTNSLVRAVFTLVPPDFDPSPFAQLLVVPNLPEVLVEGLSGLFSNPQNPNEEQATRNDFDRSPVEMMQELDDKAPLELVEEPECRQWGSQTETVHVGFSCACTPERWITGPRFQCALCDHVSLCATCEAAGLHPKSHPLLKIRIAIPPDRVTDHLVQLSRMLSWPDLAPKRSVVSGIAPRQPGAQRQCIVPQSAPTHALEPACQRVPLRSYASVAGEDGDMLAQLLLMGFPADNVRACLAVHRDLRSAIEALLAN